MTDQNNSNDVNANQNNGDLPQGENTGLPASTETTSTPAPSEQAQQGEATSGTEASGTNDTPTPTEAATDASVTPPVAETVATPAPAPSEAAPAIAAAPAPVDDTVDFKVMGALIGEGRVKRGSTITEALKAVGVTGGSNYALRDSKGASVIGSTKIDNALTISAAPKASGG